MLNRNFETILTWFVRFLLLLFPKSHTHWFCVFVNNKEGKIKKKIIKSTRNEIRMTFTFKICFCNDDIKFLIQTLCQTFLVIWMSLSFFLIIVLEINAFWLLFYLALKIKRECTKSFGYTIGNAKSIFYVNKCILQMCNYCLRYLLW